MVALKGLFDLQTPEDLLQKLRHDLDRMKCSSLNSTLRTILARPHVSDTDWYPSRILSVMAIYRQPGLATGDYQRLD